MLRCRESSARTVHAGTGPRNLPVWHLRDLCLPVADRAHTGDCVSQTGQRPRRTAWRAPGVHGRAALLLATEPLDKVTGRVTYSQEILKEFGWITAAKGRGVDPALPVSGYSQR